MLASTLAQFLYLLILQEVTNFKGRMGQKGQLVPVRCFGTGADRREAPESVE